MVDDDEREREREEGSSSRWGKFQSMNVRCKGLLCLGRGGGEEKKHDRFEAKPEKDRFGLFVRVVGNHHTSQSPAWWSMMGDERRLLVGGSGYFLVCWWRASRRSGGDVGHDMGRSWRHGWESGGTSELLIN